MGGRKRGSGTIKTNNVQQLMRQGDLFGSPFSVHKWLTKQWFLQSFSIFQNICPAISMQLLVCNLQLFTAGNASRPGVRHAIEALLGKLQLSAWLPAFTGEGIYIPAAQPCQVTHWQEQGVNLTWPHSPAARPASFRSLVQAGGGCFSIPTRYSPNAGTSQISNPEGIIVSFLYMSGHSNFFLLNIFG